MPERKILIAGQNQSGSTKLYNFLRFAFLQTGRSVYGGWHEIYDENHTAEIHIVKCHEYRENLHRWADIVLTSRRDFRDSLISTMRRWPNGHYCRSAFAILDNYLAWRPYADLEIAYEDWQQAPAAIYERLTQSLHLPMAVMRVAAEQAADLLSNGEAPAVDDFENGFYRATLLSRSHNTSNGQSLKYLTEAGRAELARFGDLPARSAMAQGYAPSPADGIGSPLIPDDPQEQDYLRLWQELLNSGEPRLKAVI